jgi:hypothetical protein
MTLRTRTVDELRGHALELAAAFGVGLVEVAGMPVHENHAVAALNVCFVAPIACESAYAGALHELGHLAAPLGAIRGARDARNLNLVIEEETAAWDWAYAMATQFGFWTAAMEQTRAIAFATYTRAKAEVEEARRRAIEERRMRGTEKVETFVERGHGAAPERKPEPPKFNRRESIADFLKRS